MLIALFTILFLGGTPTALIGEISIVQDSVKLVMPKNDARKAVQGVLKKMEKVTKAQNKQVSKSSKQLANALADHEFDAVEIDRMWSEYHQARGNFQMELIALRFELKEHISREEWAEIFSDS
jgi:predicted Rossmann fold nucleotide-binding protein DprA/Smf involved in DNA uptake